MVEFPIKSHYIHIFYAFCDVITSRQQLFMSGLKYLCIHDISCSFKVGQNVIADRVHIICQRLLSLL